jgi:uracil-DNA glycosylase family 4
MRVAANLCALALKQLIGGACKVIGLNPGEGTLDGVVGFLTRHFVDQSQRLMRVLEESNHRAWRTLELALAGDSLWDRCKLTFASAEDRAFRDQVRPFLDACPLAELHGKAGFRQACLKELQAARKAGHLTGTSLGPAELARRAGALAHHGDPTSLLAAEDGALTEMADDLRGVGYADLAAFVALRPGRGDPLLLLAARYFFRKAVEEDSALFQGLTFAQLEVLQRSQEEALAGLTTLFTQQGDRLAALLDDLTSMVSATRDAVLDIRDEQRRQGDQNHDIYQAVIDLQQRLDLLHREVRPGDSLSLRNDAERRLVRELVARYRGLPEGQRQGLPALLNAVGKLEVAAGDFAAAQGDFLAVANLVADPTAQAEAHANAYQAALERRNWDTALAEIRAAARLDPARFAPFPLDKYQPQRILGAGGFGVAFLCRHRYLSADVVVKAVLNADLDRDIDEVFAEAQALRALDHPAIIRVQDCGFAREADNSRPYLVMDYFEGGTLDSLARERPLTPPEAVAVARQLAAGLRAAHGQGILHRDVKPANVLVRPPRQGEPWAARLIDFGLALRRERREAVTALPSSTLAGTSIAGTLEYASPEQMGRLPGVSLSPAADIYGFALFGTPQPLPRHWRSLAPDFSELLEQCLEERPDQRPRDGAEFLRRLDACVPEKGPQVSISLPVTAANSPSSSPAPAVPAALLTVDQRREELQRLATQVGGCMLCPALVRSRSHTVFGIGPLDPDLMFIGEAPGADEDRSGEPFVGAAGQVFNGILSEVRQRRDDVYILNLLKCRPPANRPPLPEESSNCRAYLERQIELVRPKAICAMGTSASQGLLRVTETIGRLRRQLREYKGIPVLCTYHPAFLLPGRSPERRGDVVEDFRMLLRRIGKA